MTYESPKDLIEQVVHTYAKPLGMTSIGILLIFLWMPIGVVSFMSFAKSDVLAFPPDELSLRWYDVFLNNSNAIEAVLSTMKIAVVVAPTCVILAVMISYAIDRYAFRGARTLQLLSTLPLIIPLIVVGIAMTMFFGLVGLETGYWTIVAAHIIEALPFATLIILPTLRSVDRSLEEASKDLGADELETFLFVTLPNITPGIVAGGLLAFTISFNEFVYTYFVKDTGTNTLPLFIWAQLKHQATPEVNVASVVFLVVVGLVILLAIALTRVEKLTMQE